MCLRCAIVDNDDVETDDFSCDHAARVCAIIPWSSALADMGSLTSDGVTAFVDAGACARVSTVVLRIPGSSRLAKGPEREFAVLRYLASNSDVAVPKVLAWWSGAAAAASTPRATPSPVWPGCPDEVVVVFHVASLYQIRCLVLALHCTSLLGCLVLLDYRMGRESGWFP